MSDKQPTEAEIKKFWEWCGLEIEKLWGSYDCETNTFEPHQGGREDFDTEQKPCFHNQGHAPSGTLHKWWEEAPNIDLNNLFKYAVPMVINKIMVEQECSCDLAYAILFKKWLQKLELDIPNHEGTLFRAIWEVINE